MRLFLEIVRPKHLSCVLVCLLLWSSLAWAQVATKRVLVVIPAKGHSLTHPPVESLVNRLKKARYLAQLEPGTLPILRLDPNRPQHRKVLRKLGANQQGQTQVLVCERSQSGWPDTLIATFLGTDDTGAVLRRARRSEQAKTPVQTEKPPTQTEKSAVVSQSSFKSQPSSEATELGVLLLHKPADEGESAQVRDFLSELGRHWVQRYGRVKPAPYPLAYYDLSKLEVVSRLELFDKNLVVTSPQAALCLFQDGRPHRVLEVYPSLELPATLVRQISSARSRHLADTVTLQVSQSSSLPEPTSVRLSPKQEAAILLGRMHESAQQLWMGVVNDDNPKNETSRRLLLRVVELSRQVEDMSPERKGQLKDALDDYTEEPLLLRADSHLSPIQARLLELGKSLAE